MAKAELERIEADPFLAADFLDRAKDFVKDARVAGLSDETRLLVLHSATVAACDAVLSISGFRIVGSEGGHRLRIEKSAALLGDVDAELFERLDDARLSRNDVSYALGMVPTEDVMASAEAVDRLIEHAQALVEPHLPPWNSVPA